MPLPQDDDAIADSLPNCVIKYAPCELSSGNPVPQSEWDDFIFNPGWLCGTDPSLSGYGQIKNCECSPNIDSTFGGQIYGICEGDSGVVPYSFPEDEVSFAQHCVDDPNFPGEYISLPVSGQVYDLSAFGS